MASLLELLASRQGTPQNVSLMLEQGASIKRTQAKTEEGPLHVLFRRCVLPLELYGLCKILIDYNVDVNHRDHRGATPLSLLILHINHGLRYHSYPLPQIQRLEDLGASKTEIQETVAAIDAKYQQQVYNSLELLLAAGAQVNAIPGIVPAIPSNTAWVEAYEHKLMQQEERWNLLGYDTSMEVSTYNIFNPVTSHRCINDLNITPLHLAAWRGDARCIKLLLDHGADPSAIAQDCKQRGAAGGQLSFKQHMLFPAVQRGRDICTRNFGQGDSAERPRKVQGRGPLHFLYMYCNKPGDLEAATRLLVDAGASTDLLHQGEAPCHVLVPHVFVKRSYHQYLSNCYLLPELGLELMSDDYIAEIQNCLILLQGSSSQQKLQDSLILETAKQFNRILVNTDIAFQVHGHYLVPYTYRLEPLTRFFKVLLGIGAKVNRCDIEGRTPLHHLVSSLRSLSLDTDLNPPSALSDCFTALLEGGANPNKTDMLGRSPVHMLHAVIMDYLSCVVMDGSSFSSYTEVLDLLLQFGGDLDLPDCEGKKPLTYALSKLSEMTLIRIKGLKGVLLCRYIDKLLMGGASMNDRQLKGFVECIICKHLLAHSHPTSQNPGSEVRVISMLCACLPRTLLLESVKTSFALIQNSSDLPDLSQNWEDLSRNCELCTQLNLYYNSPATLKTSCRRAIRESVGSNFQNRVKSLPLPPLIIRYLLDLTQH